MSRRTQLMAAVSGLAAERLVTRVPPSCRGPVVAAPAAVAAAGGPGVEIEWPLGPDVRRLLPSLSALTPADYGVRMEVSARLEDGWSPWVAAAPLGPAATTDGRGRATSALACDVDAFAMASQASAARLRMRLTGDAGAVLAAPWVLSMSAASDAGPARGVAPSPGPVALEVPSRSQFAEGGPLARRLCSPTCVAMVLGYWGRTVDLATLAAEMFHPGLDLYGVWPAAIRAAARHGLAGYLLHVPDWPAAAWCLDGGMPLIASVRYAAGELTGAAIPATDGHLIVLTGHDGDRVLVNDPAAPDRAGVARHYRLDELARVWLDRTAVAYVLFDPEAPVRAG